MIFRECRRFFKSSALLATTGVILLVIGVGVSGASYCLLVAFSAPRFPGLRSQGYSTVAIGNQSSVLFPVNWLQFEAMQDRVDKGIHVAAYSPGESDVDVSVGLVHRRVKIACVSTGFFANFALPLLAGRDIKESESNASSQNAAILGASLAQSLFGSSQHAVGEHLTLNGMPYQVVGVAAPSFRGIFDDSTQVWTTAHSIVPLHVSLPSGFGDASSMWKMFDEFYIVVTDSRRSSQDLAASIEGGLPRQFNDVMRMGVTPGISFDPGRNAALRHWLRLGLCFSCILAAVSCLNVCLLLLTRSSQLSQETRLKQALGASNIQIIYELVAGPLAMMCIGVVGGVISCMSIVFAVARLSSLSVQTLHGAAWSMAYSLGVIVLIAFVAVVIVALIPAIMTMRSSASPSMGSTTTTNRYTIWLIQGQVSFQICCGIAVVILASMITSALLSALHSPLGFEPAHRFVVSMEPTNGTISFTGTTGASTEFLMLNQVIESISTVAGVQGVSYAGSAPFAETPVSTNRVENQNSQFALPVDAERDLVTAGFFHTIGSRIVNGRDISAWLKTGIDHETVINTRLANELFSGIDPLGRTFVVVEPARNGIARRRYPLTVVGIVEDIRPAGYGSSPRPTFYEEAHASTDAMPHLLVFGDLTQLTLEVSAKRATQQFMHGFRVRQVYSLSDKVSDALAPDRYRAVAGMVGATGMVAVAGIGLYSALMFFVRSRRREIAIRVCLGATPGSIHLMVVRLALQSAVTAAIISLPAWLFLYRLSLSNVLGTASWSTGRATVITVTGVACAVLLSILPAWRSTTEPPANVLKEQ